MAPRENKNRTKFVSFFRQISRFRDLCFLRQKTQKRHHPPSSGSCFQLSSSAPPLLFSSVLGLAPESVIHHVIAVDTYSLSQSSRLTQIIHSMTRNTTERHFINPHMDTSERRALCDRIFVWDALLLSENVLLVG
jgi:hypothetical protein